MPKFALDLWLPEDWINDVELALPDVPAKPKKTPPPPEEPIKIPEPGEGLDLYSGPGDADIFQAPTLSLP